MSDLEYIAGIIAGNVQTLENMKVDCEARMKELKQENPEGLTAFYYRGVLDMLGIALAQEKSEAYFMELLQK